MSMQAIVPLAGPDFVGPGGRLKAEIDFDGGPLLKTVLESRSWTSGIDSGNYIFALRDLQETRAFADRALRSWFPGCRVVFLSDYTKGAALSVATALGMVADFDAPLIVDLADIAYDSDLDPADLFRNNVDCGAIALTFESTNPVYSYLRTDDTGAFVEAAEKRVISRTASAGTYMFANTEVYLKSLAHALANGDSQTHNGLYFVCPLFNGVRDQGLGVHIEPVQSVRDIKTLA